MASPWFSRARRTWVSLTTYCRFGSYSTVVAPPRNLPAGDKAFHTHVDVRRMYKGCTEAAYALDRTNFEFGFGSGTGIRTLNLAVNRSLRTVQRHGVECQSLQSIGALTRHHECLDAMSTLVAAAARSTRHQLPFDVLTTFCHLGRSECTDANPDCRP